MRFTILEANIARRFYQNHFRKKKYKNATTDDTFNLCSIEVGASTIQDPHCFIDMAWKKNH